MTLSQIHYLKWREIPRRKSYAARLENGELQKECLQIKTGLDILSDLTVVKKFNSSLEFRGRRSNTIRNENTRQLLALRKKKFPKK